MWLAFRLLITLGAFLARYLRVVWPPAQAGMHAGEPWYKKVKTQTRDGRHQVVWYRVGIALRATVVFTLEEETGQDRFFKRVGLAHEFQTGDENFDRGVYIACDHPVLHRALHDRPAARSEVMQALRSGFRRISGDGRVLWLERVTSMEPSSEDVERLVRLRTALGELRRGFLSDPYEARIVAIEALVWSVFAYAVGAGLAMTYGRIDTYLDGGSLLVPGVAVGVVMMIVLAIASWLLLRKSSMAARVLVEVAALLVISAPVAGIQLLADANRVLDFSPPFVTTWQVRESRTYQPSKSPSIRYLRLAAVEAKGTDVGYEIAVPARIYYAAGEGSQVRIVAGRGAFGYPWIRTMEVVAR